MYTITREVSLLGISCPAVVEINQITTAKFHGGETARFFVKPGEILLRVGIDPYGKDSHWTQRETILRSDEIKFFRLSMGADGTFDIQRGNK